MRAHAGLVLNTENANFGILPTAMITTANERTGVVLAKQFARPDNPATAHT